MKAAISFVIILSIHTALTFPQCDRPDSFTGALEKSYEIFKNILGYKNSRDFSRAHVVPWEKIKAKIFEMDPSVSFAPWKTEVTKLIEDLHDIDYEWFGNKELQKDQEEWVKYGFKNDNNKKRCEDYLERIDETQIQSIIIDGKIKGEMKSLCKCLFSAPANIRPGYETTNNLVGSCIDPLTISKPKSGKVIKCSDITDRSKSNAKKYGLHFRQYKNQYTGRGIATSDQLLKDAEELSTTQC